MSNLRPRDVAKLLCVIVVLGLAVPGRRLEVRAHRLKRAAGEPIAKEQLPRTRR